MKWFEIHFKNGTWTRITSYNMLVAVGSYDEETILSIKEVADGAGNSL